MQNEIEKIKVTDHYALEALSGWNYEIECITDMHFSRTGSLVNRLLLSLLIIAGFFVLVISCINIVNLLTAMYLRRAKEIAIRKVVGALRKELITQFLIEAIVLSLFSLIIALALVEIFLPLFNTFIKLELNIEYFKNWGYLLAFLLITLFTGLLSGIYPAFFLSSFKPVVTLKGERTQSAKAIRKILVVAQFIISIGIFICSFIINREINVIQNKDLGFENKNIIIIKMDSVPSLRERYQSFKKVLLELKGVSSVTASSHAGWIGFLPYVKVPPGGGISGVAGLRIILADNDFLKTYIIYLVEGEGFAKSMNTYSPCCIINEKAKKALNLDSFSGKYINLNQYRVEIVGVIKDYHYTHPLQRIEPLVIVNKPYWFDLKWDSISMRLSPDDIETTLDQIKEIWRKFFPTIPFEYSFVEEQVKACNDLLSKFMLIFKTSTVITLIIACIGLFSLAMYETERRTKEVGIRKVVGATSIQIVFHFLKTFLSLVFLANIIAWPMFLIVVKLIFRMIKYPFPMRIGFAVFIMSGVLSIIVTIIAVGYQTFRAASVNPIHSLRYE